MYNLKHFAKVKGGVVIGLQQANKKPLDNMLFECLSEVDIGWAFDGVNFSAPVVEVEIVRNISPDAMRDRFTFDERVAIKSSPNMQVQTFYDDLSLRKRLVNLDSDRFALAMQLLLSEQLIEVGRDIILLADGTPDEVL